MKKFIAILALAAAPVLFAQNKLSNSQNEIREVKTVQKLDTQEKAELKAESKVSNDDAKKAELKKAEAEKAKIDREKALERRNLQQSNQKSLRVEDPNKTKKSEAKQIK